MRRSLEFMFTTVKLPVGIFNPALNKRIGKKSAERLLKLSVDLFHPKIKEEEVLVDTTVQGKNITFPTDAKLAKKVIDTCRKIANKEDITLRQSYSRTAP
jgi:transposase, IS5 family